MERLELALPGWRSVADMWNFLDYAQAPAPDATRFEGGTPNFIGALSLNESIKVMQAAGTERIAAHVLGLTDRLAEALASPDAEIVSIRDANTSSGIVTFRLPGVDSVTLGNALQREGFVTTYRQSGVRVAPHGYNTPDEIDAFAAAVRDYRKVTTCSR
jgi:selenocysteine lyase/cysteine desulfurase